MLISRLKIIGEIDCDTPEIVLKEICICSGIKFTEDVKKISNNATQKISLNYENDANSLRIIARYVNPNCNNWRRENLLKAFLFLKNFENDEISFENPDFTSGLQTPENTKSLNACVLYKLCKKYSLKTCKNSSLADMASLFKLFLQLKSPSVKNSLQTKIYDEIRFYSNPSELINLYQIIGKPLNIQKVKSQKRKNYTYEEYSRTADRIENGVPKNALEAIVFVALNHKIDISSCEDPFLEYQLIIKNPYFPFDKNLLQRMRETELHPDSLLNPYLNCFFNPNLPENMYSPRDLITLFSNEGEKNENVENEDYYSFLQVSYLTETFIHGKQSDNCNENNTFLENIKDKEYDEVVLFGIRNINSPFKAYTYAELTDTFSNYKRFSDPITNEIFSEAAIERLYKLTQKDRRRTESEEAYSSRIELGEEIERVKIYMNTNNKCVEDFLKKYESLDEVGKEKVEHSLNLLLQCAMYMRNWDGVSDYPLTSEQTNFDAERQIVVDTNVTNSLIEFEKSLDNLKPYNLNLLKLPLMQYQHGNFTTSNDEAEGLTIQDRIRIVRGGENETMNSCIRLSSNKFTATAYFYMVLIGFRIPFSISEVSQIF
jgi:hypothetical protein